MEILEKLVDATFFQTLVVGIIGGLILQALRPKAKVVWGQLHQFLFLVPRPDNPPNQFHTKTIVIQNFGRQSAEGLDVVFNFKPEHYEIWPSVKFQADINPDGKFIIRVDWLAPKEFLYIELLSSQELPLVNNVKWKAGVAKLVNVIPQRVYPPIVLRLILLLILSGALGIVYVTILGIKWIAG